MYRGFGIGLGTQFVGALAGMSCVCSMAFVVNASILNASYYMAIIAVSLSNL